MTDRSLSIRAECVAWLGDDPQPRIVEVHLPDAAGRVWRVIDKAPIFDAGNLLRARRWLPAADHYSM